jgi:hypothetical protein
MLEAGKALGSHHVCRPPGRRGGAQLDPGLCPSLGRGDDGEGLAGPCLADHDGNSFGTRQEAADKLALVGLQGRASVNHTRRDQLACRVRSLRSHSLRCGQRLALKLPDSPRGVAGAFRALRYLDHGIGREEGVRQALDLGSRRTLGKRVGDGLDRLAAVEVGRRRRDRLAELNLRDGGSLGAADPQRRLGVEGARDRLAVQADLIGPRSPARQQLAVADVALLRLAGGECCDLHRARGGVRARRLEYLRAAGGEGPQVLVGEARDLGDALAGRLPLDPEAAGQLMAKVGLVDVGGGLGVVVDRRVVEAGPAPVRSLRRVGDQDVGVQLRIAVARGAVEVARGQVAVALDELRASGSAPRPARLALHVAEGGGDRFAVGSFNFDGGDGSAQAPQQGDGLGGGESEIEAGNRAAGRDAAHPDQRLPVYRVATGQHRFELRGLNLAGEAQVLGGVAKPFPGDLALAGVVVLSAFGDLVEVVALLSFAELSDGQHLALLSVGRAECIGARRQNAHRREHQPRGADAP